MRQAGGAAFRFTHVFDECASQEDVFEATALPLVRALFDGASGVVLAYGVTCSGKTWTISGSPKAPGVLPRALDVILRAIQGVDARNTEAAIPVVPGREYRVFASYLEVYNEQCYDLFEEFLEEGVARKGRRVLKLKEDAQKEVYAEGLTEVEITSASDVQRLLEIGKRSRQMAQTLANEVSSRSHSVFFVTLKMTDREHGKVRKKSARLSIVDLAGSERVSKMSSKDSKRIKESNKINSSLMNLGRCLGAMRHNQKIDHQKLNAKKLIVPFRVSKLTRLLQHCLESGSAVLIANASPAVHDADATIQALRVASLAQEITVPAKGKEDLRQSVKQLSEETPKRRQPVRSAKMRAARDGTGGPISKSSTSELNKEIRRLKKEVTLLRVELEEEKCARKDVEKQNEEAFRECDELFRENEKLKDRLADSEARIYVVEAEVREELTEEVKQMLDRVNENWQTRFDEVQAENDKLLAQSGVNNMHRLSLGPQAVKSTHDAEKVAARLARRVSRAAFEGMKVCLMDEDEAQGTTEGEETEDDEEYIEEESEDENELNREKFQHV